MQLRPLRNSSLTAITCRAPVKKRRDLKAEYKSKVFYPWEKLRGLQAQECPWLRDAEQERAREWAKARLAEDD